MTPQLVSANNPETLPLIRKAGAMLVSPPFLIWLTTNKLESIRRNGRQFTDTDRRTRGLDED